MVVHITQERPVRPANEEAAMPTRARRAGAAGPTQQQQTTQRLVRKERGQAASSAVPLPSPRPSVRRDNGHMCDATHMTVVPQPQHFKTGHPTRSYAAVSTPASPALSPAPSPSSHVVSFLASDARFSPASSPRKKAPNDGDAAVHQEDHPLARRRRRRRIRIRP